MKAKTLICLALGLITLALYLPSLRFDFLGYDDQQYVTENPHVLAGLTGRGLIWAFGNHAGNWHPLAWISHQVDCQIYGLRPWGHHLTNALLHAANTVLLFLVLLRMTGARWRSAAVAALFGWHPLHVESVAWVAERKDVLSTFFALLSQICYLRFALDEGSGLLKSEGRNPKAEGNPKSEIRETNRIRWYVLALVFFGLGLLSKPMVVTLPFVLLLLDYWPLRRGDEWRVTGDAGRPRVALRRWTRLVLEKVPFFALAAGSCWLTLRAQEAAIVSTAGLSVSQRIAHAVAAYAHYLGAAFVPRHLAILYPYVTKLPTAQILISGIVLAGISLLVLRFMRSRQWLLVGWLWFLGTLVPVIGLVQVGDQAWADRYTYLPLVGVFMAVVWTAVEIAERWVAGGSRKTTLTPEPRGSASRASRFSLTPCFSWVWRRRQRENRFDGLPQAAETVETVVGGPGPSSTQLKLGVNEMGIVRPRASKTSAPLLASALGVVLLAATSRQLSYWRDTRTLFEHAAKVTRNNYMAVTLLGSLLAKEGKYDEAISHYRQALGWEPNYAEAHFFLGHALDQQGKPDEAIGQYRQALWYKPTQEQAHIFLGVAFVKQNKSTEAVPHYLAALKINPDSAVAHNNLAKVLHTQGKLDKAAGHYRAAIKLDPDLAQAHNNFGILLLQKGKPAESSAELREALKLNPDNPETEYNLALALNQKGQWKEAAELFAKTVGPGLRDANAHHQFATALAHERRTKEALREYAAALLIQPDFPDALEGISWILATAESPEFRNGTEAVRMAERACELTGRKDAQKLKTLAAAYAEAGQFPNALATIEQARQLATAAGMDSLTAGCRLISESFAAHRPWRENFGSK